MIEGKILDRILAQKEYNFKPEKNSSFLGLKGSSIAFILKEVFLNTPKPTLIIVPDKEKAAYLFNDLQALLEENNVLFYPESHRLPYHPEKTSNANIQERAEILSSLSRENFKGLMVTYPLALSEKITTKSQLSKNTLQIKRNEKLSIDFISEFLNGYDFQNVDFVFEPGQYSIRGGIIDVYSYANEFPFRLELFGGVYKNI
jgi:transcription-repair coupling factor (superfamily II helicase)